MVQRLARGPVAALVAACSFAAAAIAVAVSAKDTARPFAAHALLLWSSAFSALLCWTASRRADPGAYRTAWTWMAGAAAVAFVGHAYVALAGPRFPSFGDLAPIATYPLLLLGGSALIRGSAPRLVGAELRLDLALLAVIMGALVFEFLLKPLTPAEPTTWGMHAALLGAAGGIAVLGMLFVQMVARPGLPPLPVLLAVAGAAAVCAADLIYAPLAYQGLYRSRDLLSLGWGGGLLLIGSAAALAPPRAAPYATAAGTSAFIIRLVAMLLGVAGLATLAVTASLRPAGPELAVLTAIGIALLAARLVYAMRRDRRYAALLEAEVARQTTTLLDSLAATAAAERELRLVMEAVPDAIMLLGPDGRILSHNEPATEWTSDPARETVGRTVFELLDANAAPLVREHLHASFEGHVRRFEVTFVRDDSTRVVASFLFAPVREGSKITKVLALARDISDTRRAETQLRQSEKLVAMGQMVSGVAHEINNPAAIISGFAQTLLLEDLKPDQLDMARMIHDEAGRIGRITANLLAFARMGSKDRSLVDLNDLVRRTFALRSYYFTTLNIAVNLDLDPDDPQIWGHGGDLQQLLLNLLINAEYALTLTQHKRVITVRTRARGDVVQLDCEDTGPGIAPDIKHRIFDPFFSTKPEGVGTGLGLSICYGIVRDHGGRITVESEPDRGAAFAVFIPRDPRSHPRPSGAGAVQAQGTLAVLLVDDEAGIRKSVARYLNRRGMQVRAVADGAEALRLLRTEDFEVIVSDVRMPGMGGRELLQALRRDRPELVSRLIFSSGDTQAPDTAALVKEAGVPSIVKPFDFAHLEQVIREVAAASSSV